MFYSRRDLYETPEASLNSFVDKIEKQKKNKT